MGGKCKTLAQHSGIYDWIWKYSAKHAFCTKRLARTCYRTWLSIWWTFHFDDAAGVGLEITVCLLLNYSQRLWVMSSLLGVLVLTTIILWHQSTISWRKICTSLLIMLKLKLPTGGEEPSLKLTRMETRLQFLLRLLSKSQITFVHKSEKENFT